MCKLKTNRAELECEKGVNWLSRHQNKCSFLVRLSFLAGLLKFMSPCNRVLHKQRAIKAQRFCTSLLPAEKLICSVSRNELHLLGLHTCFLVHGNSQLSNQQREGANSQSHTDFAT